MGKTSDLFKKTRYSKGTFHANMGTIKDINSKGLTESEEIKKEVAGIHEELYKKSSNDPYNHNGVVSHLQQDILE